MEFLKKAFGDKNSGIRAGGILSTLLGSAIGFYFGGGLGAAIGLIGGTLLSPIVNETLFQIQRSSGNIAPKARNTDIKPNTPTRDIAAPVLQKTGAYSQTSISAPILENLEPPPESAITESFNKRDELWNMLVKGGSSLTDFETLQEDTKQLEAKTDTFIATIDAYDRVRASYMAEDGKRQKLVTAVTTSMQRPTITNPLNKSEIERFVPTLPEMSASDKERSQQLMDQAMPESIKLIPGVDPFPIETYTRRAFTNDASGKQIPEKLERWNAMTKLERLNASLDQLDTMRFNMEHEDPIDWALAAGSAAEGERVRKMPPEEMLKYSADSLAKLTTIGDKQSNLKRAHLLDISRFAKVVAAREKVQGLVEDNLGGVVQIYSDFRENALVPATAQAKEFAGARLEIFNKTGVAVMDKGTVDIAHSPDGIACHSLSFKDCTAKEGTKETTIIMQKVADEYRITHRITGPITDSVDWNKAELKDGGVPVQAALITELKSTGDKPLAQSFKELIERVNANETKLALSSDPIQQLSKEFELHRPSGMTRLAVSDTDVATPQNAASLPQAVKTKENESLTAKKAAEYTV